MTEVSDEELGGFETFVKQALERQGRIVFRQKPYGGFLLEAHSASWTVPRNYVSFESLGVMAKKVAKSMGHEVEVAENKRLKTLEVALQQRQRSTQTEPKELTIDEERMMYEQS